VRGWRARGIGFSEGLMHRERNGRAGTVFRPYSRIPNVERIYASIDSGGKVAKTQPFPPYKHGLVVT
jgi:hypothetical protein